MKEETVKIGRPKKFINQETFEGLCKIQCTELEICAVLGVTDKVLNNFCHEVYDEPFSAVLKSLAHEGKASLRRRQIKLSETNPAMCIWLGKQYLGQREPDNNNLNQGQGFNINVNIKRPQVSADLSVDE